MSVRKFQLLITRSAREDFTRILAFTRKNWGEDQRIIYKNKIEKALRTILEEPDAGRKEFGHIKYSVEHHKIYYNIDGVNVTIVRILHERMDVERHLN